MPTLAEKLAANLEAEAKHKLAVEAAKREAERKEHESFMRRLNTWLDDAKDTITKRIENGHYDIRMVVPESFGNAIRRHNYPSVDAFEKWVESEGLQITYDISSMTFEGVYDETLYMEISVG